MGSREQLPQEEEDVNRDPLPPDDPPEWSQFVSLTSSSHDFNELRIGRSGVSKSFIPIRITFANFQRFESSRLSTGGAEITVSAYRLSLFSNE